MVRLVSFVLGRPSVEPEALRRLFWIGLLLAVIGFVAAAVVHEFNGSPEEVRRSPARCACQADDRGARIAALVSEERVARTREAAFAAALDDSTSALFGTAREGLAAEEARLRDLARRRERLSVQTLKDFWPVFLLLGGGLACTAFVAGRAALEHGRAAGVLVETLQRWGRPFWSFVAVIFLPHELREIWTSVMACEGKSWFGWSSFCVSPVAWVLMSVTTFGVAMIVAYAASVVWCLGRGAYRPSRLDPLAADGAWGVESYVTLLQSWSWLAVLFITFPISVWVKLSVETNEGRLTVPYLLPGLVAIMASLVVSGRFVKQAVHVRLAFRDERARWNRAGIARLTVPPDPTRPFLGEHWWNLPAALLGIVVLAWTLTEWSGAWPVFRPGP